MIPNQSAAAAYQQPPLALVGIFKQSSSLFAVFPKDWHLDNFKSLLSYSICLIFLQIITSDQILQSRTGTSSLIPWQFHALYSTTSCCKWIPNESISPEFPVLSSPVPTSHHTIHTFPQLTTPNSFKLFLCPPFHETTLLLDPCARASACTSSIDISGRYRIEPFDRVFIEERPVWYAKLMEWNLWILNWWMDGWEKDSRCVSKWNMSEWEWCDVMRKGT